MASVKELAKDNFAAFAKLCHTGSIVRDLQSRQMQGHLEPPLNRQSAAKDGILLQNLDLKREHRLFWPLTKMEMNKDSFELCYPDWENSDPSIYDGTVARNGEKTVAMFYKAQSLAAMNKGEYRV